MENELKEGIYKIPPHCVAASWKGNLIVRKSKKWKLDTNRCRNCAHFGKGYTTRYGPYTTICLNSPKTLKSHNKPVYYAAKPLDKACDMFEPRNDNDGETNNS